MKHKKVFLVIIAVVFLAYGNALFNGFTGDAKSLFKNNNFYKNPSNITKIFTKDFLMQPQDLTGSYELGVPSYSGFLSYRPVTALFFFFDYFLWKDKPWGHHLTNLLLHIFVCLLLYVLVLQLTRNKKVSVFSVLLFAAHPIHSEAVCNVGYRSDIVSTLFLLLTLVLYLHFKKATGSTKKALGFSYATFFLALFSKETALALPILLFFMDYWFCAPEEKRSFLKGRKRIYLVYLAIFAFYIVVYFFVMKNIFYGKNLFKEVTFLDKCALIVSVFSNYMAAFLLPWKVNVLPPLYVPAFNEVGIIIFLILLIVMLLHRTLTRQPEVTFWLLWFVVTILPVSNAVLLLNPYAFRFMYLPSVGVLVLIAYAVIFLLDFLQKKIRWKHFEAITKAFLIGLCISLTMSNNAFLKNSLVAAKEMIRNYPDSSRPYWILGLEYFERGQHDKAIFYLSQYLKREPRNPFVLDPKRNFSVYYLLGRCHLPYGRRSIPFFKKAILLKPDYVLVYKDLIQVYLRLGETDKAHSVYQEAKAVLKDGDSLEYLKKVIDEN